MCIVSSGNSVKLVEVVGSPARQKYGHEVTVSSKALLVVKVVAFVKEQATTTATGVLRQLTGDFSPRFSH